MITGIIAFIVLGGACWLALRRAVYNIFDPLIVVTFFIPCAGGFLAFLCDNDLVTWDKFGLFCLVLFAYLWGARMSAAFFGLTTFRETVHRTLARITHGELVTILLLTVGCTLVLAVLGIQAGAQGDARQDFARLMRPLVLFQSGLFSFSLVLLLSSKVSNAARSMWLFALVILSIPFSGKSILLPVLYWYGFKLYLDRKPVGLGIAIALPSFVAVGVGVMGMLAYGASSIKAMAYLFLSRLWLSGDTYIYAYQQNGLEAIRGTYQVGFLAYMLHPITSLVGLRAYEKPLGAMLQSEVFGVDVLTGPNPHLPVIMDFFFPNQLLFSFLISFTIGMLVVGIRPFGAYLTTSRSRYLGLGGIVAVVFCPGGGFLDFSQVLIGLVGITSVIAVGVMLELIFNKVPRYSASTGQLA